MLKKSQRLTTEQVNLVIEKGKTIHSPLFTMRFLEGVGASVATKLATKFAAIAPKRLAKTAVARNLARRRAYEALAPLVKGVPSGFYIVFIYKERAIGADLKALSVDLAASLKKIKGR